VVLVSALEALPSGAVRSVLSQSYPAWELLLVTTADSPPPPLPVNDPRVRLVPAPGASPATARARALATASGTLVTYLSAAERMTPQWLAAVVAALAEAPAADVVVGERLALAGDLDHLPDLAAAAEAGLLVRASFGGESLSALAHRRDALGGWHPTDDPAAQIAVLLANSARRHVTAAAVLEPLVDLRPSQRDQVPALVSTFEQTSSADTVPVPARPA
ncbi:MAG: glycosyltransferase, partial [Acidimicrobiales bacterium]